MALCHFVYHCKTVRQYGMTWPYTRAKSIIRPLATSTLVPNENIASVSVHLREAPWINLAAKYGVQWARDKNVVHIITCGVHVCFTIYVTPADLLDGKSSQHID